MVDVSKVPGIVTLENTSDKDVKIFSQPGTTQGFVLTSGETIKFLAEHSYELVSFLAQGSLNPGLVVTLPTKTVNEE